MNDNRQIARAIFDAFQANDMEAARRLLSADFQGSQNGGPVMDRETLLGFSGAVNALVKDFRYEDITCAPTDTGFVEEHNICGTLPDGETFDLRLCVVARVEGGKITALSEYFDSAGVAGLAKALAD